MTTRFHDAPNRRNLQPRRQTNFVTLTDEQIGHLLSELGAHPQLAPVRDVALLIVSTGLRLREAAAVRWSDIDFDRQIICVKLQNSATPCRAVPLELDALIMLSSRRNDASPEAFVFGPNPLQFFHRAGRTPAKLSIELDVPHVSFHMLRRTFVVRLVNSGCPPLVMARILGWHSPGNILSHYVKVKDRKAITTEQQSTVDPAPPEASKDKDSE